MNAAHPQQASPPHIMAYRGEIPSDGAYRPPPPPGAPQYHGLPPPQQPQAGLPYPDPYNQMPASRGPIPDGMRPIEGLPQLQPGAAPHPPPPDPVSKVDNGWRYQLVVVQQPRRARMCGFGDKDRRPITPPPCVRLIITDIKTGKEVDCNDIDHSMFVLNVDLWSEYGDREVNLVRHSSASPSISAGTPVSFQENNTLPAQSYSNILPGQPQNPQVKYEQGQGTQYQIPQTQPYNPYPQQGPPPVNPYTQGPQHGAQYPSNYPPQNSQPPYQPQNSYGGHPQPLVVTGPQIHAQGQAGVPSVDYQGQAYGNRYNPQDLPYGQQRLPVNQAPPQGMFTRNLIGSLSASAFRLTDTQDRIGIWFVLQDLSVRTEGHFRLRFSFVNVGVPSSPTSSGGNHIHPSPSNSGASANGMSLSTAVNMGKAPVLASTYSDVFTVYSAKKFPGVVESTHLSKCFATQGIKIPIRKDGPSGEKGKKGRDGDEYEED